jgi:hypothetical protein
MAEDVNTEEEEIEEEEEQGADARQTLDDLTVLTDTTTPLDDPESQVAGDDGLEWVEPYASQSLATIHSGSRPTDAEIMANLVPEGEAVLPTEEIDVVEEEPEAELPAVAADVPSSEPERRPEPESARTPAEQPPQAQSQPAEEPAPAPEAPAPDERPEPPAAEEAAPPPATAAVVEEPVVLPPEEEEEDLIPEEEEDQLEVNDAAGSEDSAIALDIDPAGADEITIADVPAGAVLSAGTDNGDGTWTLTAADLDGLTITPPPDSDADFTLSITAGGVTEELDVTVEAVANDVAGVADDVTGKEDSAIALDLQASFGDTRTVSDAPQIDVGDDGFDAATVGTDSADTLTSSSGDDVISGEGGDNQIDGGDGNDTLIGGDGNDTIEGGDGDNQILGGDGDNVMLGGAGDDDVRGGAGDNLFIFGAGNGADYFHCGNGWSDMIQVDDVTGGPGGDSGWTLQVDEGATYTQTENGIQFDAEASGVITLSDGSELTFDGVEKLEW